MKRVTVVSTNLKSIGYEKASKMLEIEFKTGAVYQYPGVPEALHKQLMNAPSSGAFFWRYIRNDFSGSRVK